MSASAPAPSSLRRQRGAASVAIAMLLMFILVAAVAGVLKMSGSSVINAATNEEQISALFLAESGVERAQATISLALKGSSYTSATCTGLDNVTANLGRGYFHTSASSLPSSCGGGIACETCTVTVKGTIESSSRTIRTVLSPSATDGVEGCGAGIILDLRTDIPGAAVITNLAYRAKINCGNKESANAKVGSCTNTKVGLGLISDGTCNISPIDGWSREETGVGNVSSMGVYANMPTANTYRITTTLVDNSSNPVSRNFVQVGALFYPRVTGSPVQFIGSYGKNTHTSRGSTDKTGTLPGGWNCGKPTNSVGDNGTAAASQAAGADTLVYGFSSWSAVKSSQMNGVTVGIQPLRRIMDLIGTQGDHLYSQIWYAYNPSLSPVPTASFASSYKGIGTATIGATFTGAIVGTTLTVTGICANCVISPGDGLSSTGPGGDNRNVTAGTTIVNFLNGTSGGNGTYTVSVSKNVSSRSMSTTSSVLNVTACTICFYGAEDVISGALVTGTPTIVSPMTGKGGAGTYRLSATQAQGNGTAFARSPGTFPGATIYLPSAQSMPAVTAPNTRIAVVSGPGVFDANTPTTVTAVNFPAPNAATNSFTVSPAPTTALNLATICGGVCAFLNANANTTFTLSGDTVGDDWSSGFACLKGVNPDNIGLLKTKGAKRSSWSEPVQ